MSKRRSRRFLLAALILSLIVHLAGGRFIHWPQVQREESVERVSLSKRLILHARPHSRTRQRVPHKVGSIAAAAPHKPIIAVHGATGQHPATGAKTSPAHAQTSPRAFRTPPPSPAAPARAVPSVLSPVIGGCTQPNQPAAIVEKAVPVISKSAREAGTRGVARVRVIISADATVTDAKLTDSSQNRELDLEALGAARASTYSPATANCKPVAGETEYAVEFVPF